MNPLPPTRRGPKKKGSPFYIIHKRGEVILPFLLPPRKKEKGEKKSWEKRRTTFLFYHILVSLRPKGEENVGKKEERGKKRKSVFFAEATRKKSLKKKGGKKEGCPFLLRRVRAEGEGGGEEKKGRCRAPLFVSCCGFIPPMLEKGRGEESPRESTTASFLFLLLREGKGENLRCHLFTPSRGGKGDFCEGGKRSLLFPFTCHLYKGGKEREKGLLRRGRTFSSFLILFIRGRRGRGKGRRESRKEKGRGDSGRCSSVFSPTKAEEEGGKGGERGEICVGILFPREEGGERKSKRGRRKKVHGFTLTTSAMEEGLTRRRVCAEPVRRTVHWRRGKEKRTPVRDLSLLTLVATGGKGEREIAGGGKGGGRERGVRVFICSFI